MYTNIFKYHYNFGTGGWVHLVVESFAVEVFFKFESFTYI